MAPLLIALDNSPTVRVEAAEPPIGAPGRDNALSGDGVPEPGPGATVVVGTIHADPAAFLLETLPRLASPLFDPHARTILCCDNDAAGLDLAFASPVPRAVLAVLGIERERIRCGSSRNDDETAFRPAPAIDPERRIAHRSFDRLLATIAERLAGPFGDRGLAGRVHLSGRALDPNRPGVPADDTLDRALAEAGWTVLRSDDRSFAETVGLIRDAAFVSVAAIGPLASFNAALAGFARPGAIVRAMVDTAAPPPGLLFAAALRGRPLEAWRFAHGVAPGSAALIGPWRAVLDAPDAPRGHARARATDAGGAAAVLGGPPTGRTRFRSPATTRPWWELDLGRVRPVAAVSVDLPFDQAGDPVPLRLLGSPDGHDWSVLAAVHAASGANALADGGSCRFGAASPWLLRSLRIQRGGDGVLALDRVVLDVADGDEDDHRW